MSEDSAPGKDGLPMEFCRIFWCLIKEDFINLVNWLSLEKRDCKINEHSNYLISKTISKTTLISKTALEVK